MSQAKVPARSEVAPEYTWNSTALFESAEAWRAERQAVLDSLPGVRRYQGHLGDNAATLADAMGALQELMRRVGRLYVYGMMSYSVDTTNQAAAALLGEAQGTLGQVMSTVSFLDPELLAVGEPALRQWLRDEPRLAIYEHYISDLFRKQAHVRSAEVEEVLGMLAEPFAGAGNIAGLLANADFKFEQATTSDGAKLDLTQGTLQGILASPDREARRTAWEHYADQYLAYKNTLASALATSIKQNVFDMRVRRHRSTLEASLYENDIPVSVFHNLIDVFRRNLPTWHRYWALRRKALKVETLQPYDFWAPLASARPAVPYQQAVEWISQGLAPMGADYVNALRQGCLVERWVDVYPNVGKTAGAFSGGTAGTLPYIMMSYNDDVFSMSTLAHELGHSMHTLLSCRTQPVLYTRYSLFVAEVASNFHQAMVRGYLFEHEQDPGFQLNLIEEAMSNFHRYFFIMPTLARWELEVHQRVEQGRSVTAGDMNALMADLFSEGYGGEVNVDRERVGITWATFPHMYADYYVYQYATGISGANALARRILAGQPGAVESYLDFLKAGGSLYPLDALKLAGVDLTTPRPVEEAFEVLKGIVDRLEKLVG
jgi:oligoendopeptidase F